MGKVIQFTEAKEKLEEKVALARLHGDPDELRKALPNHIQQPPDKTETT